MKEFLELLQKSRWGGRDKNKSGQSRSLSKLVGGSSYWFLYFCMCESHKQTNKLKQKHAQSNWATKEKRDYKSYLCVGVGGESKNAKHYKIVQ